MSGKRHKKGIWLDPRAKLFLILMCVLSSMFAPSLAYQFVLVMLIAVLGAFFGKWKYVIKAVCFYAVICALTVWIMAEMTGTLRTMFIAFLGLFHKVYACGTLAGIVLTTTKVNEFLSAMNRVHAPKKLVIPMAVMLRYIPTIQEDWRYIKDAMRMRDVSPSLASFLAHPGMTVECIYVPLLMAASKAADDLSVASVTRGIENPNPRTCLVQIKCGISDWGVMAVAVAYLILNYVCGRCDRLIEFENVSFSYTGQEHGGLHDINLKISDGECVLFCGRSGCGKTTITRLVNGLIPQFYQGELQGRVLVDGQEISNIPMYQIAAKVGSVFQNPRTQFFNVDTDSEIAFGIENEARPPEKLAERVEQTTEDLHIQKLRNRNIFELSGGEKQKIAFASVYAMNPHIYLLDEPSSNLDMTSIQELKEHLRLIKKQAKQV